MNPEENIWPVLMLGLIIDATIAGWVYFDAKAIGVRPTGEKVQTGSLHADLGPAGWAVSCFLLLIVALPAYLIKRPEFKRKFQPMQPASVTHVMLPGAGGPASPPQDFEDQLRKLAKLRDEGIITPLDFEMKKREILAPQPLKSGTLSPATMTSVQTPQVSHALVWGSAFIPLMGLVLDAILFELGWSTWFTTAIVIGTNILLLTKDEAQLKLQGVNTEPIGAAWLVPVYLFKRVQVVGGGYGYAVCWMVTFFISLFRSMGI